MTSKPASSVKPGVGLFGRSDDVNLLKDTLMNSTWPGNQQRIHPVWAAVVQACCVKGGAGRGGADGGAAGGAAVGRSGVGDGSKEVLKCLWTRAIQQLSPPLQLQIARESWRIMPQKNLGIALPNPLVKILGRTMFSNLPFPSGGRESKATSAEKGARGGGRRGGSAWGDTAGAALARASAGELLECVERRVRGGDVKPGDCSRMLRWGEGEEGREGEMEG